MEIKTNTSKFLDTIDNIDRYFYGRKMKNFVLGSVFVLILAPLLDELLEIPHDRLTMLTTFVFFIYCAVLFLAWISAWRDDQGKVTWMVAKARLQTYWEVFSETARETKTNSRDENLYKLASILLFGSLGWKAIQNLSVFIRKPIESLLGLKWTKLRSFEVFTKHWYWVLLIIGLGIMIYLYKSNKDILLRIKEDLRQLFNSKRPINGSAGNEVVKVNSGRLVLNTKIEDHILEISTPDKTSLFQQFVVAMQNWNPGNCQYEYEYQNKLFKHLKKIMKDSVIEMEYPIGESALGNKGRADIVIDETILIEMKRDSSSSAIQRAKGQILQYSDIWRNRGPVILLLCNYEYEHAKLSYSSTMTDLNKLDRPVLTFVASN